MIKNILKLLDKKGNKLKLIFHIGAGKTGSTSIQNMLKKNINLLKEQNIFYLGLMLENAPLKKYDWQIPTSVVEDFHRLSDEEASEQILSILHPTITYAKEQGIHTLVWSNESFLGRSHNFTSALKQLQNENIEIEIVIYVREYCSWARSAYIQWGIKHKTYSGKIQTFEEWISRHQPIFYKPIKDLLVSFPNAVRVRNMSATSDVVKDFISFINIDDRDFVFSRDNSSPSNEEILFRALFNNQYNGQVLPNHFNHVFKQLDNFSQTPEEYLQSLLPNQESLQQFSEDISYDKNQINKVLSSQNEQTFENKEIYIKDTSINSDKLLLALTNIVMQQSKKINSLEALIKKLDKI